MLKNRKKIVLLILIGVLLLLPFIVMLLWNNILVALFSIKAINYLQALGLFVLCRILFGSFRFGNKPKQPFTKQFLKNKMMNLTDDEKCKMKEEWEKRKMHS